MVRFQDIEQGALIMHRVGYLIIEGFQIMSPATQSVCGRPRLRGAQARRRHQHLVDRQPGAGAAQRFLPSVLRIAFRSEPFAVTGTYSEPPPTPKKAHGTDKKGQKTIPPLPLPQAPPL